MLILQRLKFHVKVIPALIAAGIVGFGCLMQVMPRFLPTKDIFQRLEWMTYDWRVRRANEAATGPSANLGFIEISDQSIELLKGGLLDRKPLGLYWPRYVYGRVVRELSAEGAHVVGFDIFFGDERSDHPPILVSPDAANPVTGTPLPDGRIIVESDDFFAHQLRAAGNVVLGATTNLPPIDAFRTNAWAMGDISLTKDADGISRRDKPFLPCRLWNSLLRTGKIEKNRFIFLNTAGTESSVPISPDGYFDLGELTPPGLSSRQKLYTDIRVWAMGIVLAARELGLDLDHPLIEKKRIILRGKGGLERVIPVDRDGYFYIDWSLRRDDLRLKREDIGKVLQRDVDRQEGAMHRLKNVWTNKVVVVGSTASGNDLRDRGSTPIEKDAFLVSRHWNVANSVIQGRLVRPYSDLIELLLIIALGFVAAYLTWTHRTLTASSLIVLLGGGYVALGLWSFVHHRFWLPLALPLLSALLNHVGLVTYRVVFEESERRRVRAVFSKVVSPNVVHELLQAEKLSLGGARRQITVYFADIRGFTEFTDVSQAKAEAYLAQHNLTGAAAEAYINEQARETLGTVNLYLATIANKIKEHEGTLDKYIGDCVMAFWGAPTPNEKHALYCVRAAIESQRAMYQLNQKRAADNKQREQENIARAARGESPLPMLPLLSLGSGINTGMVTVGLMGSDAHILNYTVFGREVNLASRLEGVSGRGRIIIGEATFVDLRRDDAALAATCVELPPVSVKGFSKPMKIFEGPWMPPAAPGTSVLPVKSAEPAPALVKPTLAAKAV